MGPPARWPALRLALGQRGSERGARLLSVINPQNQWRLCRPMSNPLQLCATGAPQGGLAGWNRGWRATCQYENLLPPGQGHGLRATKIGRPRATGLSASPSNVTAGSPPCNGSPGLPKQRGQYPACGEGTSTMALAVFTETSSLIQPGTRSPACIMPFNDFPLPAGSSPRSGSLRFSYGLSFHCGPGRMADRSARRGRMTPFSLPRIGNHTSTSGTRATGARNRRPCRARCNSAAISGTQHHSCGAAFVHQFTRAGFLLPDATQSRPSRV